MFARANRRTYQAQTKTHYVTKPNTNQIIAMTFTDGHYLEDPSIFKLEHGMTLPLAYK